MSLSHLAYCPDPAPKSATIESSGSIRNMPCSRPLSSWYSYTEGLLEKYALRSCYFVWISNTSFIQLDHLLHHRCREKKNKACLCFFVIMMLNIAYHDSKWKRIGITPQLPNSSCPQRCLVSRLPWCCILPLWFPMLFGWASNHSNPPNPRN